MAMRGVTASIIVIVILIVLNNPHSIVLFVIVGLAFYFMNRIEKKKAEKQNLYKKPNSWAENKEKK
jgi:hypothetical protein